MQSSLSMRIPKELEAELIELAKATGRSKSFLAVEAIKNFVEAERWQISKIQNAIKEADAGNFAAAEEMHELDKKWGYGAN